MFQTERMLKHLPFFETLTRGDETSPEWRMAAAGLVVLRLVDDWTAAGLRVVQDDWGVQAVREAIAEIPDGKPVRVLLTAVVDSVEAAEAVDMTLVAPRLMAYARALDLDGHWELAADVYRTVIAHIHPTEDADIAVDAHMRLGYCERVLGRLDAADAVYLRAGQIAAAAEDVMGVLRSRLGEANVAIARGNLPHAEGLLDDTIQRADACRLRALRSMALHDRAAVAFARGDFEFSVRLAYEALEDAGTPQARDRLLADIATLFIKLGVRSAARDAHLILAATAQEQYARWSSLQHLMEIAAIDHCEPIFEQYRRELAAADLPPRLETEFQLSVGRGYLIFGNPEGARTAVERALLLATEHQYHQSVFRAEQLLNEIARGTPAPYNEPAPVPTGIEDVATALQRMRGVVTAGG